MVEEFARQSKAASERVARAALSATAKDWRESDHLARGLLADYGVSEEDQERMLFAFADIIGWWVRIWLTGRGYELPAPQDVESDDPTAH